MNTAIFPGSFDPFTCGHAGIVKRALPLFDKIIIAFGMNSAKKRLIPLSEMKSALEDLYKNESKVEVTTYSGLTVNFCNENNIGFILRGLRNSTDFEYEKTIAHLNNTMDDRIETVFLVTTAQDSSVSSTIVREIVKYGGDASKFVPREVNEYLKKLDTNLL